MSLQGRDYYWEHRQDNLFRSIEEHKSSSESPAGEDVALGTNNEPTDCYDDSKDYEDYAYSDICYGYFLYGSLFGFMSYFILDFFDLA